MSRISKQTGTPKLYRLEERSTDVDAFYLDALRITAARRNFVGPESQSGWIWFSIEEIKVLLSDKE
jgi:hypothetical protein